jgi:hypothetical protein
MLPALGRSRCFGAWRGVVQESDLSTDVLKVFKDNFTFFRMAESHILCYLIPSEKEDTAVGQRRLNWVWYWNLTEAELDPLLTDPNGVRRAYAIPPGALHPEPESRQRKIAERVLPPAFNELLRSTKGRLCRRSWTWPILNWSSTAQS